MAKIRVDITIGNQRSYRFFESSRALVAYVDKLACTDSIEVVRVKVLQCNAFQEFMLHSLNDRNIRKFPLGH